MSYGNPHPSAIKMAQVFEEHSLLYGGDSYLSETGYDMLKAIYGEVPEEMLISVFNDFTRQLYLRGISYKPEVLQDRSLAVNTDKVDNEK